MRDSKICGMLYKVDPGTLGKADPMPKFIITVKNSFLINLRALISNMIIVFSNSSPKMPK